MNNLILRHFHLTTTQLCPNYCPQNACGTLVADALNKSYKFLLSMKPRVIHTY